MKEAFLLILLFSGVYIVIDKLLFFVTNDSFRTLLVYACMFFFFLWFIKKKLKDKDIDKKQVQLGKIRWGFFSFLCIGTVLCKFVPIDISLLDIKFEKILVYNTKEDYYLDIISYCLFAPFLEEFVIRGLVLAQLLRRYSPIIAILLSALIFGLMHPCWVAPTFLFGILSGIIYYYTSNLTYSILLHSFANLISQLLRFYLNNNVTNSGKLEAILGSNMFYMVYIIITIGFVYLAYRIFSRQKPIFAKDD